MSVASHVCRMHTLASADSICFASSVTNHCITVDINLWTQEFNAEDMQWLCDLVRQGCASYHIFENLSISDESEHLHGEALVVWWKYNPGVTHNRMQDWHVTVIPVLAAGRGQIRTRIENSGFVSSWVDTNPSTMMSQLGVDVLSSLVVAQQFSNMSSSFESVDSSATSKYRGSLRYFTTG